MERKSKEIQILGHTVKISERNAEDVFAFLSFMESQDENVVNGTYLNAYVISDSLKPYIEKAPLWKRWELNKLFTRKNLIKKCSVRELAEIAREIAILEGLDETDEKKKVSESPEK